MRFRRFSTFFQIVLSCPPARVYRPFLFPPQSTFSTIFHPIGCTLAVLFGYMIHRLRNAFPSSSQRRMPGNSVRSSASNFCAWASEISSPVFPLPHCLPNIFNSQKDFWPSRAGPGQNVPSVLTPIYILFLINRRKCRQVKY